MTYAEQFAATVTPRIARNLSADTRDENLTGVEVIAILSAILAACDQFNPGWRDQLIGLLGRLLPPWGRAAREAKRQRDFAVHIRRRAERAFDPDRAGLFGGEAARRDRLIVVNAVRSRVQSLRDGGGRVVLPTHTVADAILEAAASADDAMVHGVFAELSQA